jgi:hypothetical protein
MPSATDLLEIPYHEGREYVLDGDVLLYTGGSIVSRCIQVAGLSQYSHVGMAGWVNGDPTGEYARLMAYEMLMSGGQGTVLSPHVDKGMGVHVYRVSDMHTAYVWNETLKQVVGATKVFDRKLAVTTMRDFCRPGEYGKMHLFWTALIHMPVVRFFFRQPTDDQLEDRTRPPYCSEAVAYALRKAFTDVVKNTPDHYTSPGALARSPLLHYMFTLVKPVKEE